MENKGIYVTGDGSVVGSSIAVGKNAHAVSHVSPQSLDDLRTQLEALRRAIADAGDALEDRSAAADAARLAERELAKEQPRKPVVLALLDLVASSVGNVASIAGGVASIQQTVSALL